MAMLVKMLTSTLVTCMNSTIGHIATPKIQYPNIVLVKLKGIQKQAINKSAIAMFNRNLVRSVLDLFPQDNTNITRTFPNTDKAVVKEYNVIRVTCESKSISKSG